MSSVEPRTIDNLGAESSSRYAQDQKAYDANIVRDSNLFGRQAEIPVITPQLPLELEEYLSPTLTLWAAFEPPPHLAYQTGILFSHQLIPSLGTQAELEGMLEKLKALRDTPSDGEKTILLSAIDTARALDRILSDVRSRQMQYQKG